MESGGVFLVAEDDPLVGRALLRALSRHGRAELVGTVEQARTSLRQSSYSALVVDVGLPDGSGFDLITEARSRDPGVFALIVSARVDERSLAVAHTFGAPYLLKPIDAAQLDLFAARTRSKQCQRHEDVSALVERWRAKYDLTRAEADILALAARGIPRSRLAEERGVAPSTVKKQVQVLLAKTCDNSLQGAVNRLLRVIVAEG